MGGHTKPKAKPAVRPALPFGLHWDDLPLINLARLHRRLPWLMPAIVSLAIISFIPLVSIYYNRAAYHSVPRWSLIPDMDNQPRWKRQQANLMFADHRSSRPWPTGTIGRGQLPLDDHYSHGIVNGQWANSLPPQIEIDTNLLKRGEERYRIYCAMCHGLDGYGNGIVSKRAENLKEGTWTVPLNYHGDQVRSRPVGHLFNTITNGIRNMPAYGSQISPADRWAIVAWIRVLQASQHAELESLPADIQRELLARKPKVTPPAVASDSVQTDESRTAGEQQPPVNSGSAPVDPAEVSAELSGDQTGAAKPAEAGTEEGGH